jgi:hypothetical protein
MAYDKRPNLFRFEAKWWEEAESSPSLPCRYDTQLIPPVYFCFLTHFEFYRLAPSWRIRMLFEFATTQKFRMQSSNTAP